MIGLSRQVFHFTPAQFSFPKLVCKADDGDSFSADSLPCLISTQSHQPSAFSQKRHFSPKIFRFNGRSPNSLRHLRNETRFLSFSLPKWPLEMTFSVFFFLSSSPLQSQDRTKEREREGQEKRLKRGTNGTKIGINHPRPLFSILSRQFRPGKRKEKKKKRGCSKKRNRNRER